MADFQTRYDFTGWISGKDLPTVDTLIGENAELKAKLEILQNNKYPDVDVDIQLKKGLNEQIGHLTLSIRYVNRGNISAKYFTSLVTLVNEGWEVHQSPNWNIHEDRRTTQYSTGPDIIFYPLVPADAEYIEIKPLNGIKATDTIVLSISLMAENMPVRYIQKAFTIERSKGKVSLLELKATSK